ncbi:MAG: hypothetical protein E4H43_03300 [Bacteroidia bacterium]|nr:MAG: hypothetical protein E4H43_03300 [Bacteroidia bacterium]
MAPSQDMLPGRHTIPSGCSVITVSKGENVFFGGNDDYINPDSYYWVEPGDSSKFGVVWIGTPDNPQQGVNEKGLAYDANGLPRVEVNPHIERIPVPGEYHNYCMQIMHECSTVEEVIYWVNNHQRHPFMHDQLHFADKNGDAVIISAGKDGEIVFTRKKSGDGFLVSTNFNVANPSNGFGYPCWRYDKAHELLGQMISKKEQLTIEDVVSVLDAVHVEESSSWTIESMAADLVNGVVYLYYFYQYDKAVILNVKHELANPREAGPLSSLFPEEVRQEAGRRYDKAQIRSATTKIIGISWTVLILLSLIVLFPVSSDNRKGFKFWLIAVIFLGPLALLIRLLVIHSHRRPYLKTALMETVGDLIPIVASYTVGLIIVVLKTLSQGSSWQLQIAVMFGLPLFAGWLVFHGPLLSATGKKKFGRFLFQRLPQVLVTTFLGLAGIFVISMPLVNKSLSMSQLIPLSPWPVMTWWAIIVISSVAGGFILFLYERWAVRRNFQAWSIMAGNEGEVTTPSWRKLWWWILLSILVLLIGLVAGTLLQKILSGN